MTFFPVLQSVNENLLINCALARSAPQILSIKVECTFLFLNFLKTGLCNSSANSNYKKQLYLA